jgi:hypothetical protein
VAEVAVAAIKAAAVPEKLIPGLSGGLILPAVLLVEGRHHETF